MPRISFEDGVLIHRCANWRDFNDFITKRLERSPTIWRGQRDAAWRLEPSLARLGRKYPTLKFAGEAQLEHFRFATRGRRGASPRVIPDEHVEEWWSLGQHHRLATPLLDWTQSPYVASFFAYADEARSSDEFRAVYGLVEIPILQKSRSIERSWREMRGPLASIGEDAIAREINQPEIVTFVRPLTDENQRLISQNGLFTRSPLNLDIEQWIKKNFRGESRKPQLYKLLLPEKERLTALRSLNRMNINYLSLYPDLEGASLHCNMMLEIPNY